MQTVPCNYCGSSNSRPVNHGRDLLLNRDGDFHLVECVECGLVYQNPQLTLKELAPYYPVNYLPYSESNGQEKSTIQKLSNNHLENRRVKLISKHRDQIGKVLDIGCSTGTFLNQMRQNGWDAYGVETSLHASEYARTHFGLDVTTSTLGETDFPDEFFDVVTMWDVLEHVNDPKETLRQIARILKPGGLLLVSVPNPESMGAKVFRDVWVGWDRPRHLHIFSPKVIKKYLNATGFKLKTIESLGGRLGLTLLNLEFWANKQGIDLVKFGRFRNALYNPVFRIVTYPFYRLLELTNRATNMHVFATKG